MSAGLWGAEAYALWCVLQVVGLCAQQNGRAVTDVVLVPMALKSAYIGLGLGPGGVGAA